MKTLLLFLLPQIAFCADLEFFHACTSQESWKNLNSELQVPFEKMLSEEASPLKSASFALYHLRSAHSSSKAFSRYFLARSLYQAKLKKTSESAFLSMLFNKESTTDQEIQFAALSCLNFLYQDTPGLFADEKTQQAIRHNLIARNKKQKDIQDEFFFRAFLTDLPLNKKNALLSLQNLKNSPYQYAAKALWETEQNNIKEALNALISFFKTQKKLPAPFEKLNDAFILLLARHQFQIKNYDVAYKIFHSISNKSPFFIQAMQGQSWSNLHHKDYAKAIGSGLGAQALWLKNVFTPESHLVTAMSLNELCRYPEALKIVENLNSHYRATWHYLKEENKKNTLYSTAVELIKNPNSQLAKQIPKDVLSEWLHSSVFLKYQASLNNLIKEDQNASILAKSYQQEQKDDIEALLKKIVRINEKLFELQNDKHPELKLPALRKEASLLRKDFIQLKNFITMKPIFASIYKKFTQDKKMLSQDWVQKINEHLFLLNKSLLKRLEYVVFNTQALTAEIFDDAGKDIIWKNAHPQAAKKAESAARFNQDTYDWGNSQWSLTNTGEIWQDELNALTAKLTDKCKDQNKYILVPVRK
jgi:hypothetical protein